VLRPVKTGAARIALGAEAVASFTLGLEVVPVGLQYEAKQTFRSDVTVWFGEGHRVADLAERYRTAPAEAVLEETRRLSAALSEVTLNVGRQELSDLMTATAIFAGAEGGSLDAAVELRKQFLDAYASLERAMPARVARLRRALNRHARVLRLLGLTTRDLRVGREPTAGGLALRALAALPLLALAIAGAALEWVPYKAVDLAAQRSARVEPEVTATTKLVAAMVLYPVWWTLSAVAVGQAAGGWAALVLLLAHPVIAYLAMTALERLERFRRRLQVFRLAARPLRQERLRRHERAIRDELQALAALYQAG
jgi:hypothetical protein